MNDASHGQQCPDRRWTRDVPGFEALAELALDLRWSWNHAADALWRELDPVHWDLTHNPWTLLQIVARERIERSWADSAFRQRVDDLLQVRRQASRSPSWFQETHPGAPLKRVAYFSMEFMLSEALPIYSGGLGNVAGDQLKAACELGVPVVGVGLLYSRGYFRQVIGPGGEQQAYFPFNDPGQLPISPVRDSNGEWLRLRLEFPGHPIWLRAWQVQVGRTWLYLLDSNDAANYPPYRGITSELYGGGPQLRLMQEIVLGIGGWRLLAALGMEPEVCHLNEGHAALAVLERARSFMQASGENFEVALDVTRAGNLFTTHTAVAAAFDRFPAALVEHCLGDYAREALGITLPELLALGRRNPLDAAEDFNMAYLGIRGSGCVNAVSRLHREVSRRLFQPLFPRWPESEVPIGYVTNGVHMPSWVSAGADAVWTQAAGKHRWTGNMEMIKEGIRRVPDAELWRLRNVSRRALVDFARERLSNDLAASEALPAEAAMARQILDPNALTLGFARRFAVYKRPTLLLHDPPRLLRLLRDSTRPVQLVIAGKAHPTDHDGQAMIKQWSDFIRESAARAHVVFLRDYDMHITQRMVQGVDVWLNTPRRPWEACGTSGMKVLVNGGINLSERDGWWAEAYSPDAGWALGDGKEHGDDAVYDASEADALYDLLENEVIPEFYGRDEAGIPRGWVTRMRNSMAHLTPRFSATRAVREYTEQHYLPAAAAYLERAAERGARGEEIVLWEQALRQQWSALRFGKITSVNVGGQYEFKAEVNLGTLKPGAVRVDLYAEGNGGRDATHQEMLRTDSQSSGTGTYVYVARVPGDRPATDFTARIVPHHPGVKIPLEAGFVLWQR
jgi:starch phosphorylase